MFMVYVYLCIINSKRETAYKLNVYIMLNKFKTLPTTDLTELLDMYYRMLNTMDVYKHVSSYTPNSIKRGITNSIEKIESELNEREEI